MERPAIINVGDVFGMSKIICEVDKINGRRYFECECLNCGGTSIKKLDDLRKENRPRTCGKCSYRKNGIIVNPGDVYGEYTLIKEVEKSVSGKRMVLLNGPFGEGIYSLQDWIDGRLRKLDTNKQYHGMSKTNFYNIFNGIKGRCENPNHYSYIRYGGRGIKCLWNTFEEFKEDMYESFLEEYSVSKNISIDRIDNNGHYCKENCRWVNRIIQNNNKGNNIKIPKKYGNRILKELLIEYNINKGTFYGRLKRGWSFDEALKGKQ